MGLSQNFRTDTGFKIYLFAVVYNDSKNKTEQNKTAWTGTHVENIRVSIVQYKQFQTLVRTTTPFTYFVMDIVAHRKVIESKTDKQFLKLRRKIITCSHGYLELME